MLKKSPLSWEVFRTDITYGEAMKVEVLVTQSYLSMTSWTVAHQAPLFAEFSRQEYWSG